MARFATHIEPGAQNSEDEVVIDMRVDPEKQIFAHRAGAGAGHIEGQPPGFGRCFALLVIGQRLAIRISEGDDVF